MEHLKEFIHRVETDLKSEIDNTLKYIHERELKIKKKWNNENREKLRELQKIYAQSKKGKKTRKKTWLNSQRTRRFREKKSFETLTEQDIEKTREFYRNKPNGYVIDHIIPLCKNGTSHISNLQYLTREENSKKGIKLLD